MILLLVLGLIAGLTLGYFFLMFVYPEWVGISGEDTQKTLHSHRGDSTQVGDDKVTQDVGDGDNRVQAPSSDSDFS